MNPIILYKNLTEKMSKIADLRFALSVMQWDQETYMPSGSAVLRGKQMATLSGIIHELSVQDDLGNLLTDLSGLDNLDFKQTINVNKLKKQFDREKKYNTQFVMDLTRTISESGQQWAESKKKEDYKSFIPVFKRLIDLKREECEIIGYESHPYNAMLDLFEEDNRCKDLEMLFNSLKNAIIPIIKKISSQTPPRTDFLYRTYPRNDQWEFGIRILKDMNYDFSRGRQDISMHPFTTSFGADDVRITTRINENNFSDMLWSSIHEGGHGLYEQGLNNDEYGLPAGDYSSLAIHESQSRLWENNVARSLPFWKFYFPEIKKVFPSQLSDVSLEEWYRGINAVNPSLIRTHADELTYHIHVIIRFELEKDIFEKKLEVEDLPSAWNKKYKDYLGLDVPSVSKGILQDVHWSHGLIGYFPTYTQGSMYAAQFFTHALKLRPDLKDEISSGRFGELLKILRENIHCHGKLYNAEELCEKFTGEKLNPNYFVEYVKEKYEM